MGKREARELARQLLLRADAESRECALVVIRDRGLDGFEEAIRRGFRDRAVVVRIGALCTARDLGLLEFRDEVYRLAAEDSNDRVRLWGIQALKVWGDERWRVLAADFVVPRRLSRYERADWKLLRAYALGEIEDPTLRSTANAC